MGASVEIFIQWNKGSEGVSKVMQASSSNVISTILGVIDHTLTLRQEAAEEITIKIDDANVKANVTRNDGIWTMAVNQAGKEMIVQARKQIDGNWMRVK